MKKLLLFIIFITYSFAIPDTLYRVYTDSSKSTNHIINRTSNSLNYPYLLTDEEVETDEKNAFKYSEHFRVIYGVGYKNSTSLNNLADIILNIAETVWNKEVEEFGFKEPKNTDEYYIDIYIGNYSAYNKASSEYVTISSSYAGYATSYIGGTPYFVINPDIDLDILKVTIAHEFFHTIQYAYGLNDVNDTIWEKNIWFLEATAVLMEDEVYDDINDYVNYIRYYLSKTNRSLDFYNGGTEYGKVLFSKYLREKYGIDFIKSIFENYDTDETILDDIKKRVVDKGSSFKKTILEFAKWVANENEYFEEGDLYPSPIKYNTENNISVGNGGFVLFDEGSDNYLNSSNPEYSQSTLTGVKNRISNINEEGLIFSNANNNLIYTKNFTKLNNFNGFHLKRGWNLISNFTDNNISLNSTFSDSEIIWVYRNGRYFGYSSNEKNRILLRDNNYLLNNDIWKSGEAAWIYVTEDFDVNINANNLKEFNLSLKNGWNFISVASSAFDVNQIKDDNITIWYFDQDNQNWEYFNQDKELHYPKIDKILPYNGYFIFKK